VPAPSGATLHARAYKLKGLQKVDLSWAGLTNAVDVFRNGVWISTVYGNQWTDAIDVRGAGSYTYQACAAGVCSSSATVVF